MMDYEVLFESPTDTLSALGQRARAARLRQDLTQGGLARRAAVAVSTIQRFERTGKISMEGALRIAVVLRLETGFQSLFEAPPYRSLDDALSPKSAPPKKKRGRRT